MIVIHDMTDLAKINKITQDNIFNCRTKAVALYTNLIILVKQELSYTPELTIFASISHLTKTKVQKGKLHILGDREMT